MAKLFSKVNLIRLIPLYLIVGFGGFYVYITIWSHNDKINSIVLYSSITFSVIGGLYSLANYLIKGESKSPLERTQANIELLINAALSKIKEESEISKIPNNNEINQKEPFIKLEENEKVEFLKGIQKILSEGLKNDILKIKEPDDKNNINFEKNDELYKLSTIFLKSKSRLKKEIYDLNRRANVNLILGMFISVIAITILSFSFYSFTYLKIDTLEIIITYIPRFSFTILAEILSFFFLNLHKVNLSDIKYYQNEISNIELKQVALIAASEIGTNEGINVIIKSLSSTERNFKLKKGESTVELEKDKAETNGLKDILKVLIRIIPKGK